MPQAEEAVRRLRAVPPDVAHAVDVEVFGANVREDSPWAKGEPLCFSVYCGPGPGGPRATGAAPHRVSTSRAPRRDCPANC